MLSTINSGALIGSTINNSEEKMKIKILDDVMIDGKSVKAGTVVELPLVTAKMLINMNKAEELTEKTKTKKSKK